MTSLDQFLCSCWRQSLVWQFRPLLCTLRSFMGLPPAPWGGFPLNSKLFLTAGIFFFFFLLLFCPIVPLVEHQTPRAGCSVPQLCQPRVALAMEVVDKSQIIVLKSLENTGSGCRRGSSHLYHVGNSVCFFPVSYFGNSWTILVEIFSKPEISAFKKKKKKIPTKKPPNQPTSLEAFHSCGKFQLKKLKVWHIFRQGKMGSHNVTQS